MAAPAYVVEKTRRQVFARLGDYSPIDAVRLKWRGQNVIPFAFAESGVQVAPSATGLYAMTFKKRGEFDSDPVAVASSFVIVGSGDSAVILAKVTILPAAEALLHVDGNPANDVAEIELHADFVYPDAGNQQVTFTFNVILQNTVTREEDEIPPEDSDEYANIQFKVEKGQPNGYAPLDGEGKIPEEFVRPVTVNLSAAIIVVADEAARLALEDIEQGQVVKQADDGTTWIYNPDGTPEWVDLGDTEIAWSDISDPENAAVYVRARLVRGGANALKLSDLAASDVPPHVSLRAANGVWGVVTLDGNASSVLRGDGTCGAAPAGKNAFTTTTAGFTMPAVNANVTVAMLDSSYAAVGQKLFIQGAGTFEVAAVADTISASLTNLGYPENVAPTTVVASGKKVTPTGSRGADGAPGTDGADGADGFGALSDDDPVAPGPAAPGTSDEAARADHRHDDLVELLVACSDETTNLTTGTAKVTFRMPYAMVVTEVRASLSTAQTSGSILTVDINEGGASILSTKLTIDNTEKTSTTAATAAVISDANLADDAEITIDVDQVGTAGAKGLKVLLKGKRA